MTQHFHFIFGNEIPVKLQITQSGKTLPQTFHKRVLCVLLIYLIIVMVHKAIQWQPLSAVPGWSYEAEQSLGVVLEDKKLTGRPGFAQSQVFPFLPTLWVPILFPLGLVTNFAKLTTDSWNGTLWWLGNLTRWRCWTSAPAISPT